jgi:hypothetical protein
MQIAYDGLWIQAADVDMRGLIAREAVSEMPRTGSGPLARRRFASTLFRDPAFLDPRASGRLRGRSARARTRSASPRAVTSPSATRHPAAPAQGPEAAPSPAPAHPNPGI